MYRISHATIYNYNQTHVKSERICYKMDLADWLCSASGGWSGV